MQVDQLETSCVSRADMQLGRLSFGSRMDMQLYGDALRVEGEHPTRSGELQVKDGHATVRVGT